MSYIPPAYNETDFSFQGDAEYTAPAYDATSFSFADSAPQGTIETSAVVGASFDGAKTASDWSAVTASASSAITGAHAALASAISASTASSSILGSKAAYAQNVLSAVANVVVSGHLATPMVYTSLSAVAASSASGVKVSARDIIRATVVEATALGTKAAMQAIAFSATAQPYIAAYKTRSGFTVLSSIADFTATGEAVHPIITETWDARSRVSRTWDARSSVSRSWDNQSRIRSN